MNRRNFEVQRGSNATPQYFSKNRFLARVTEGNLKNRNILKTTELCEDIKNEKLAFYGTQNSRVWVFLIPMTVSHIPNFIGQVRRTWMFSFHPYAVFLQMTSMRTLVWTLLRTRKQTMSPAMVTVRTNNYAATLRKYYSTLNEYELHVNAELYYEYQE
jgi:carbohydrate-binding DOMON domain-containing protein